MSPPWKSELRLRLDRAGCTAQWLGPWSRKLVAQTRADGDFPACLRQAVEALRAATTTALPKSACLMVPDELVYLSLRPASPRYAVALQDATEHFVRTLSRQDIVVQVAPLPAPAGWLAAAIEQADLHRWREALQAEDLTLDALHLSLVDDLAAIAADVGDRALVAVLREEGMTVLRVADGAPIEVSWERCDQHSFDCMTQRLLAHQLGVPDNEQASMFVVCRSEAQRESLRQHARGYDWILLLRGADPMRPLNLKAVMA